MMIEIVTVRYLAIIYLACAVKVLEFIRIETPDLQDGNSKEKGYQYKN
jgi:hypothetical protein